MKNYDELFLTTTDTVAGIGAPISRKNKKLIYELKQRPKSKGLIIMVATMEQARKLKGWSKRAEEIASKFWPGSTTLVLNKKIAVRMPDVKGLLDIIKQTGPIYMTSANISGELQLSFDEASKKFPMIKNKINFGEGSGKPSTIIRVKDGEVLR